MGNQLLIQLFGAFNVETSVGTPLSFRSDKARGLLAYLVVEHNRAHRRDALCSLLWPDTTSKAARHSLSVTLSSLRKAFKQVLPVEAVKSLFTTRNKTIQFHYSPEQIFIDFLEFQRLIDGVDTGGHVTNDTLGRLTQAEALYSAEFLHGFYIPDVEGFDSWLWLTREQGHRKMLGLYDLLITNYWVRGDHDSVIKYGQRQLAFEPWREKTHRYIMQVLALQNRPKLAYAQYEKCRQILNDELGLTPDAQTSALHRAIQTGTYAAVQLPQPQDKPARPTIRHNLPAQTTPFFGRENLLAHIDAALNNNRLVTLVGLGGIGKTRLAIETGLKRHEQYPDGAWFVPLVGIDGSASHTTYRDIVTAVGDALGIIFSGAASLDQQLIDALRTKELLLILDNFEHVLNGADIVIRLLTQAPNVQILATTRERLNFSAEYVLPIEGLPVPSADETNVTPYKSIHLFLERAQRGSADFSPTPTQLTIIAEICRLVAGSPLGIELAAANMPYRTPSQIVAALRKSLDVLSTHQRDVPARHRSLRAVFDSSWALLTSAEQQLLANLAIFRGGFSLRAVEAVAGGRLPLLKALIDKSLVKQMTNQRYVLHEQVRQFSAEKQHSPIALRLKHTAYYLNWIAAMVVDDFWIVKHHLTEIALDYDNIREAWKTATAHAQTAQLKAAHQALLQFCLSRGMCEEGLATFKATLDQLPNDAANKTLGIYLLLGQAALHIQIEQRHQALALCRTARTQATALHNTHLLAHCNLLEGLAQISIAPQPVPGDLLATAREQFAQIDDYVGEARACIDLGILASRATDFDQAVGYLSNALTLAQRGRNKLCQTHALLHLADAWQNQKRFDKAKRCAKQALTLAREIDNGQTVTATLNILGHTALNEHNYGLAQRYLSEAQRVCQQQGFPANELFAAWYLGIVQLNLGHYQTSEDYLLAALALANENDNAWWGASISADLAWLYFLTDRHDDAYRYGWSAVRPARQLGNKPVEAHALWVLAQLQLALDQLDAATETLRSALAVAETGSAASSQLAVTLTSLAHTAWLRGDYAQAQTHLQLPLQRIRNGILELQSPFWMHHTIYTLLTDTHPEQAQNILEQSYRSLQLIALHLDAVDRLTFLNQVAFNQQLVRTWGQHAEIEQNRLPPKDRIRRPSAGHKPFDKKRDVNRRIS